MPFFTKKQVTIEAIQWAADNFDEISNFIGDHHGHKKAHEDAEELAIRTGEYYIRTLEGVMTATKGDWIIKGVKGEFYPCKPDIFEATYSPTSQQHSSSGRESAGVKQLLEDFLAYVGGNFTQHGTGDDVYWDREEGEDREMNYEGVVEDYLFDNPESVAAPSLKDFSQILKDYKQTKDYAIRLGATDKDWTLENLPIGKQETLHTLQGYKQMIKDLDAILYCYEEGFEENMAQAIEILKALVGLKELKDSRGKTEYYLLAQPVAWERAKQYLESLNKKP